MYGVYSVWLQKSMTGACNIDHKQIITIMFYSETVMSETFAGWKCLELSVHCVADLFIHTAGCIGSQEALGNLYEVMKMNIYTSWLKHLSVNNHDTFGDKLSHTEKNHGWWIVKLPHGCVLVCSSVLMTPLTFQIHSIQALTSWQSIYKRIPRNPHSLVISQPYFPPLPHSHEKQKRLDCEW